MNTPLNSRSRTVVTPQTREATVRELAGLLDGMKIPAMRRRDWGWLVRNMGVRNSGHPRLARAMELAAALAALGARSEDQHASAVSRDLGHVLS